MAEKKVERKKPVRRSVDERIAEIDAKIAAHEKNIETLKAKKEAILNPKPRASKSAKMKAIASLAKETGRSEEDLLKALGLSSDE